MMNALQLIEKAKIVLIMNEPFFATLALQKEYIADPSVGTACVNGKVIRYAPKFVESLKVEEVATLLAHECLHPAFLHHLRRAGRDPQDWNKACDYAINGILRDSKFKMPESALIDSRYDGKSAEDIFQAIHQEPQPEPSDEGQQGDDGEGDEDQEQQPSAGSGDPDDADSDDQQQGGQQGDSEDEPDDDGQSQDGNGQGDTDSDDSGDGEGETDSEGDSGASDGDGDEEGEDDGQAGNSESSVDPDSPEGWGQVEDYEGDDPEEEEAEVRQQLAQAMQAAQMMGKGSAGLERAVADLLAPKIDWKEVLQRFLAEVAHNDYTWTRPNSRYAASGLYLPSLNNIEVGRVVFVVDTSGSIDQKMLDQFASELKEAMQDFSFPVTVIYADDDVAGVEELDPDDTLHPVGFGGTDYRPAFDYIDKMDEEPRAVIYFTDGYCDRFPAGTFDIPTLWAVYERSPQFFNPPFGEVVAVK